MGEENKGTLGGTSPDHPRREELDYYEVDLRDYIRILWRGKWIVLATVAVALGVSALISFFSPDVYSASLVLAIETLPRLPGSFSVPTPHEVTERAKDQGLLASVLGDADRAQWFVDHAEFETKENLVSITLEGPESPMELVNMLGAVAEGLRNAYAQDLGEAISLRLTEISLRKKTLEAQITEWQGFVDKAYREALRQREEIRTGIEEIKGNPSLLQIEVGLERRTLEGALAEKELDLLFSRLRPVESLIDGVERLGILYFGQISGRYVDAKTELLSLQEEEALLQELRDRGSVIRVVRGPNGSGEPVGPNRGMNLAVAGVLGLFMGILLAFLWNCLREDRGAVEVRSRASVCG
ncbi:Wzz/FepE/Etk N-terminal domain-containing protein [Candidatus Bipolaricaulota sp. J31]